MIDRTVFTAGLMLLAASLPSAAQETFDLSSQIGPNPVLPDPNPALVTGMKVAEVVGWQQGQTPKVTDGLKITAFATDLGNPRNVYTLPNGDVLVVQSQGPNVEPQTRPKDFIRGWIMSYAHGQGGEGKESNLITLLQDTNRDGTVDQRSNLVTGLNSPFGVVWFDDTLYVAATDAILAYPYKLGETKIAGAAKVLTPLPGGPIDHHWTKDLVLSPDGKQLYVGVGSNSNITENGLEAEKGRAAIWVVDRATGAARVFASGLRNPNGLSFNPDSGALWAVVNERDELGANLVPDYMTSVKDGAFYGWPWSYYGPHVDPRVYPPNPDMVAKAIPPDYALSSHVAPLGMVFTKGSAMPAVFANGAFVGEHGSWNRDAFNGYQVVYVPFSNGVPSGKAQPVVTGFIQDDKAHGRPVGVAIDGTGALLIADDAGGTVWRVAAADGTVLDRPIGTDEHITTGRQATGSQPASQQTAPVPVSQPVVPASQPAGPEQNKPTSPAPSQTQIAPATGPDQPKL